MAFNPGLLIKLNPSSLFTQPATIPNVQPAKTAVQIWTYQATADTLATVEAAGYFVYFADWLNTLIYNNGQFLQVGDLIYCVCSNGNVWLEVATIGSIITTVVAPASAGSVVAASIAAGAVTSPAIATNIIQYSAVVGISNVLIDAMHVAPIPLLVAPPAGSMIVINQATLNLTGATVTFAGGGAIALQYGAAAAGAPASTSIPAATWNGFATTNSNVTVTNGNVGTSSANTNGIGIYLSNATAAFTGGTTSVTNVYMQYSIVPVA